VIEIRKRYIIPGTVEEVWQEVLAQDGQPADLSAEAVEQLEGRRRKCVDLLDDIHRRNRQGKRLDGAGSHVEDRGSARVRAAMLPEVVGAERGGQERRRVPLVDGTDDERVE